VAVATPEEKVTHDREGAVTVVPGAPKGAPRPASYFFPGAGFRGGPAKDSNRGYGLP
jgi:hypothetical protein